MTNNVNSYLKYANLQIAAESFLDRPNPEGLLGQLKAGNGRSSRFTNVLAQQFLDDGWSVKAHQANTTTGFSGTLFENPKTHELVMSFRSTEFADDAARDNEATNANEIKPFGWAFGQLSDMMDWYDSLLKDGKLTATDKFSVTGYSLGGHLAAAFTTRFWWTEDKAAASPARTRSTAQGWGRSMRATR